MHVRYSTIVTLAAALILALAAPALATTFSFTANLTGGQEVGPNASPGTGTGFFVYDDVANTLTSSISFCGLLGTTTASHIHGPAGLGVNASVIHPFPITTGIQCGNFNDVWSGLTSTQVGWLNSSLLYANIHTNQFPGGEIRGQILPEATPSRTVSWGKIKTLYR